MAYSGAGLILLTPELELLLIQDAKTKKWGFPKGHREPEDISDIHTATREVLEETGIPPESYTIHNEPFRIVRGSSSYIFRYAVTNSSHSKPGVIQNRHEISGLQWVPLNTLILFDTTEGCYGNKYLRSWITDLSHEPVRKSIRIFHDLCRVLIQRFVHQTATQSELLTGKRGSGNYSS